uniref:Uncharacterized protein n=1 Tax=Oryza brachyantha TaxID=4533 RepID=J3LWY8_ORYBR
MAKVALLLLFLVQVMNVLGGAAAARPLQGGAAADGGSAIAMILKALLNSINYISI